MLSGTERTAYISVCVCVWVCVCVLFVLLTQMLEMFETDDTNMQSSGPDFVPTVLYESLRKEFEELQEKYSRAQAAAEGSSIEEPGLAHL